MNTKTLPPAEAEPKPSQVMTEVEAYANIITATERLLEKAYDRFSTVLRADDGKDLIGIEPKKEICELAKHLSDLNDRLKFVNISLERLIDRAEN